MKPRAQPKQCVATLISDKRLQGKTVTRDKDGLRITIKGTTHQEDITVGTSLVVQWLRICLARQGRQFQSLVWAGPTHHAATKAAHHEYCAPRALEPTHRQEGLIEKHQDI